VAADQGTLPAKMVQAWRGFLGVWRMEGPLRVKHNPWRNPDRGAKERS